MDKARFSAGLVTWQWEKPRVQTPLHQYGVTGKRTEEQSRRKSSSGNLFQGHAHGQGQVLV